MITLTDPIKTLGLTTKTLDVTTVTMSPTHVRISFAKRDAQGNHIGTDTRSAPIANVRSLLEAAGKHEDKLASVLSKVLEPEIAHSKAGAASPAAQAAKAKLAK